MFFNVNSVKYFDIKGFYNRSANFSLSFKHIYANNSSFDDLLKRPMLCERPTYSSAFCGFLFFLVGCSQLSYGCRVHKVCFDRHNRYLIILEPLSDPIQHMPHFSNQHRYIRSVITLILVYNAFMCHYNLLFDFLLFHAADYLC